LLRTNLIEGYYNSHHRLPDDEHLLFYRLSRRLPGENPEQTLREIRLGIGIAFIGAIIRLN